jgi:hypothetical protein
MKKKLKQPMLNPVARRIWVTKYALGSIGIFPADAETSGGRAVVRRGQTVDHYYGVEWQATLSDALAHAEVMRRDKIHDLMRQLDRVRTLEFASEVTT